MLIVDKLKGNLYTRIKKHMTKKMYHLYYRENREASQSKEEYEANLFAVSLLFDDDQFNMPILEMSNYILKSILDWNIREK